MILRPTIRIALLALFALAFIAPSALGQAATCEVHDIDDPTGDQDVQEATTPVTGLDQVDLTKGCVAEDATSILLVVTTTAQPEPDASGLRSLTFTFHATINDTAYAFTYDLSATTANPAFAGASTTVVGTTITLSLPRAGVGRGLSDFFVESEGQFVQPTGIGVTEATDRAPDGDAAAFPATASYRTGSRAPPTLDSDGDGVTDRNEIAGGTDPNSLDSDFDGLLDGATVEVATGSAEAQNFTNAGILALRDVGGLIQFAGEAEFGTNASHPDTDGDGLLDGANVTAAAGSEAARVFEQFGVVPFQNELYLGEFAFGADPRSPDTDEDGIADDDEVTGKNTNYGNTAFFPGLDGSTNPNDEDTDGDGLLDGQEQDGAATVGGKSVTFDPTDPNGGDTDHDGLTDLAELRGVQVDSDGTERTFPPTNPAVSDTDGDSYEDGLEVAAGSDPTDPNSIPQEGGEEEPGGAEASYLWLSTVAMLVVGLLCVVGILVRWG